MKFKTENIIQPNGRAALLVCPLWESFDPTALVRELKELLAEGRALSDKLGSVEKHTFASLVLASEEFEEQVRRLWSPAMHLNNVMQTDALREASEAGAALLSEYQSDIGQHEGLYNAYIAYKKSAEYQTLGDAEKKIVDDIIDDFNRSGVGLSEEKKLDSKS